MEAEKKYKNINPIRERMTVKQIRRERPDINNTVCFYISKGLSIKRIAKELRLTVNACGRLVKECKESGIYERYLEHEWAGLEEMCESRKGSASFKFNQRETFDELLSQVAKVGKK